MSGILGLGEVVADIYRDRSDSAVELPFTARPGGAPANVAVAVARLGAEAAFIGSVGDDLFGDFIMQALQAEGVHTASVTRQSSPTRTSLAFVEIAADGARSFTFYRSSPAADEMLAPEDVAPEAVAGADFVNFGSIPLLKDPAASAVHEVARLANENGVPVAFDVNLRVHLWESVDRAREAVEPLLDSSTVVKLGDDEVEPLLGTGDYDVAARNLLERGVSLVLISLGPDGAFYASEGFSGTVPAYRVEVVDATGAGDAFLAATLVHLAGAEWDEERVREAVLRGTAAGSLACTGFGAMSALPTQEKLNQFISQAG